MARPRLFRGSFWSSVTVTHVDPWVAYQIVGGVQPTDVVTWTTPDSWVLASNGNAKDESGTAANYLNSYEPGLYGYLDFNLSPSAKTLKNGWNGPSIVSSEVSTIKNVIHRIASPITGGGFAWGNITSYDATTGYPLAIGAGFSGYVDRAVLDH